MHIYCEPIRHDYTLTKLNEECGIAHWHLRMEFVYVLEGVCEINVGKTSYLCSAGDMAVINPSEIHSIANVRNSKLYVCTFNPEILRYFCSELKFLENCISGKKLSQAGIAGEMLQCFEEGYREHTSGVAWNDLLVKSNIIKMYGLLVRHFEDKSKKRTKNSEKFLQFQEAMLYIEEHYAEKITLSDIARVINYNTSYASSLFVSYTGKNFKTYLDSFRINKAVKLIKSTDYTVSEISAQCGFANIRTFNNVFHRITGMTPSELRNTNTR